MAEAQNLRQVARHFSDEPKAWKLLEHIRWPQTTLHTDSYRVYSKPGNEFAAHETVNHGEGEYSRGTVHTNTAEDRSSQLNRSIDGNYHVSEQHQRCSLSAWSA